MAVEIYRSLAVVTCPRFSAWRVGFNLNPVRIVGPEFPPPVPNSTKPVPKGSTVFMGYRIPERCVGKIRGGSPCRPN